MSEYAEFKSGRWANVAVGVGFLALTGCVAYIAFFSSEDEFLGTRVRRGGGIIKLIEQAIGWEIFVALMLAFGAWLTVYAIVSLWKAADPTPDVVAHPDRLDFHPAVRRSSANYEDVSHWDVEYVSGHPVLWIHFYESYWSLQGLFKRKTVKLEGGQEDLDPLIEYFANHPVMGGK